MSAVPSRAKATPTRVEHLGGAGLHAVGEEAGTLVLGERRLHRVDDRMLQALRLECHDGVDASLELAGIAEDAGIGLDDVGRVRDRRRAPR